MENNEINNNDITLSKEDILAIVAERDQFKAKAIENESKLNNVVEEIKSLRKTNTELKEKTVTTTTDDIDSKVMEILKRKENEDKLARRQFIVEDFFTQNKEFSPDNDIAGLKREALRKKFERFSLPATASDDEVREALKDAAQLVTNRRQESTVNNEDNIGLNPNPAATYSPSNKLGLTDVEKAAAQRVGWDEKKFLEMRQKFPALVESLL